MLEKKSRKLSYYLRHCQKPLYIDPVGGWAEVAVMLEALKIGRAELDEIVATDEKQRYLYDPTGTKIRAQQGHSIPGVELDMERPEPPEFLYHGTADRFLPAILAEGLKPMSRQWVHISSDVDTAVMVGKRHGDPVILKIRARALAEAGYALYRFGNGVWQTRFVPAAYMEVLE